MTGDLFLQWVFDEGSSVKKLLEDYKKLNLGTSCNKKIMRFFHDLKGSAALYGKTEWVTISTRCELIVKNAINSDEILETDEIKILLESLENML